MTPESGKIAVAVRTAIVSDIHGNRTAFEAVLADLRLTSPDVIFHGGDLADSGSSGVEIVDRIRDLGWPGVVGNTDEMLFQPEAVPPLPEAVRVMVQEMALFTREALGEERLAWLRELPLHQQHGGMTLVHASAESCWRAPGADASDAELEGVYGKLGQPVAVYGHIHRPYVRRMSMITVANAGSVSLSLDGDRRAAYLLIDDEGPEIRRVEYDVEREIQAIRDCGIPHPDWLAKMLRG